MVCLVDNYTTTCAINVNGKLYDIGNEIFNNLLYCINGSSLVDSSGELLDGHYEHYLPKLEQIKPVPENQPFFLGSDKYGGSSLTLRSYAKGTLQEIPTFTMEACYRDRLTPRTTSKSDYKVSHYYKTFNGLDIINDGAILDRMHIFLGKRNIVDDKNAKTKTHTLYTVASALFSPDGAYFTKDSSSYTIKTAVDQEKYVHYAIEYDKKECTLNYFIDHKLFSSSKLTKPLVQEDYGIVFRVLGFAECLYARFSKDICRSQYGSFFKNPERILENQSYPVLVRYNYGMTSNGVMQQGYLVAYQKIIGPHVSVRSENSDPYYIGITKDQNPSKIRIRYDNDNYYLQKVGV